MKRYIAALTLLIASTVGAEDYNNRCLTNEPPPELCNPPPNQVPEPKTWLLLGVALGAMVLVRRRKVQA